MVGACCVGTTFAAEPLKYRRSCSIWTWSGRSWSSSSSAPSSQRQWNSARVTLMPRGIQGCNSRASGACVAKRSHTMIALDLAKGAKSCSFTSWMDNSWYPAAFIRVLSCDNLFVIVETFSTNTHSTCRKRRISRSCFHGSALLSLNPGHPLSTLNAGHGGEAVIPRNGLIVVQHRLMTSAQTPPSP